MNETKDNRNPLHKKTKSTLEEFTIDNAIKDHLNQLMIPYVTKVNQTMTQLKSVIATSSGDRTKIEENT